VGSLDRGQPAPSPPARGLGSAVSSPSGVRGGTLAAKRFSCILEASDSFDRVVESSYHMSLTSFGPTLVRAYCAQCYCYRRRAQVVFLADRERGKNHRQTLVSRPAMPRTPHVANRSIIEPPAAASTTLSAPINDLRVAFV